MHKFQTENGVCIITTQYKYNNYYKLLYNYNNKLQCCTYSEGSALRIAAMSCLACGLPACWSMREDRTKPFFCEKMKK